MQIDKLRKKGDQVPKKHNYGITSASGSFSLDITSSRRWWQKTCALTFYGQKICVPAQAILCAEVFRLDLCNLGKQESCIGVHQLNTLQRYKRVHDNCKLIWHRCLWSIFPERRIRQYTAITLVYFPAYNIENKLCALNFRRNKGKMFEKITFCCKENVWEQAPWRNSMMLSCVCFWLR